MAIIADSRLAPAKAIPRVSSIRAKEPLRIRQVYGLQEVLDDKADAADVLSLADIQAAISDLSLPIIINGKQLTIDGMTGVAAGVDP